MDTSKLIIELEDKASLGPFQVGNGFIGIGSDIGFAGVQTGGPLAIVTGAVGALVKGVQAVRDIAIDMAEELRPYSGEVASAYAMNEANRIQALLERDAKIGADLGKLVTQQGEMDLLWMDIKTSLVSMILPTLIEVLQWVKSIATTVKEFWDKVPSLLEWGTEILVMFKILTRAEANAALAFAKAQEEAKAKAALEAGNKLMQTIGPLIRGEATTLPEPNPFPGRSIPGGIY